MSVQFVEEFQSRLLATHCFLDTILMEDAFEIAFIESAKSAGFKVNRATPGQRFWDVEIDGSRISLKSSKAKSLKAEKLHISKLCEAAWIQDCRSSAMRQEKTFDLFREYSETVDSIIQFRYFRNDSKYQLVEFPVQNFNKILLLDRQHFTADGPTIKIPTNAEIPDYSLKIDRSDSKITIANINNCLYNIKKLGTQTQIKSHTILVKAIVIGKLDYALALLSNSTKAQLQNSTHS